MSDLVSKNLNMIFKSPKGETVHALKDINFKLNKGELLTVLGPSGCGKTIVLITHSVEEALLLGERVYVMAPRPGRIHREYNLPFASMGLKKDLRDIKNDKEFVSKREEILTMIWDMEEEIMGKEN